MDGFYSQNKVDLADVCAVPVPEYTRTHHPVPYRDALVALENRIYGQGLDITERRYGLGQKGQQLFARYIIDMGDKDYDMAIGLRQSYNKTLAIGTVAGGRVGICDNGMFTGSAFHQVRKNTTNVWDDFRALLDQAMATVHDAFDEVRNDCTRWKTTLVDLDPGYEILGKAYGRNVLTTQQATIAFQDWKVPRHSEFSDRNLFSLYQCVTEALKKGPVGQIPERHIAAHNFFVKVGTA
jgi:hypothetical protein